MLLLSLLLLFRLLLLFGMRLLVVLLLLLVRGLFGDTWFVALIIVAYQFDCGQTVSVAYESVLEMIEREREREIYELLCC